MITLLFFTGKESKSREDLPEVSYSPNPAVCGSMSKLFWATVCKEEAVNLKLLWKTPTCLVDFVQGNQMFKSEPGPSDSLASCRVKIK